MAIEDSKSHGARTFGLSPAGSLLAVLFASSVPFMAAAFLLEWQERGIAPSGSSLHVGLAMGLLGFFCALRMTRLRVTLRADGSFVAPRRWSWRPFRGHVSDLAGYRVHDVVLVDGAPTISLRDRADRVVAEIPSVTGLPEIRAWVDARLPNLDAADAKQLSAQHAGQIRGGLRALGAVVTGAGLFLLAGPLLMSEEVFMAVPIARTGIVMALCAPPLAFYLWWRWHPHINLFYVQVSGAGRIVALTGLAMVGSPSFFGFVMYSVVDWSLLVILALAASVVLAVVALRCGGRRTQRTDTKVMLVVLCAVYASTFVATANVWLDPHPPRRDTGSVLALEPHPPCRFCTVTLGGYASAPGSQVDVQLNGEECDGFGKGATVELLLGPGLFGVLWLVDHEIARSPAGRELPRHSRQARDSTASNTVYYTK